jgi:hypothetical protein
MPATPMISAQWPQFLLPIIRDSFYQQMDAVESAVAGLYGERNTDTISEYSQGIGAGGLVPEYNAATAEGAPAAIQYDSFAPLYPKTFTVKQYAKGLAIERLLMRTDQSGLIRERAQSLGLEYGQTLATHRSSVFVNAFSSDYVGADAVALCSALHPNRPDDTGTTFSNAGSAAFSYPAVMDAIATGFAMTNDRGLPMPAIYDTLVIGIANAAKAKELFGATGKPGGADNDASALPTLNIKVDPYLGATKNWFLVDSKKSQFALRWYWLDRPGLSMDPTSDYNLVAKYRGYMAYSFGWNDPRWIYGSEVA